jgi:transcriptional regulator with XRE-family HTH domain
VYRRIRDLREDRDLTQKQVASYLNCSQQVYSNYELGQRDIPTQVLLALAKLHKTSVDYILGITNTPKPYPLTPNSDR